MGSEPPVDLARLETVGCSLCGGTEARILFRIRGFPVQECLHCRMQYVSPRLKASHLLDLYSGADYFNSPNSLIQGYRDYAADRDNIISTVQKRFQWIRKHAELTPNTRLLDVGCAMGFSLEAGMDYGWTVQGIEPSPYAVRASSLRLTGRILQSDFDSASFAENSFDLVLLWDVIEHHPEPARLLGSLRSWIRPGGWISVITPDCGSLLARAAGRRWMEYAKPTEHIHFFSRPTLGSLAGRIGLDAAGATTAGKFVTFGFLFERISAALGFPIESARKFAARPMFSRHVYVDVGDKMHLLFRRALDK